MRCVFSYIQFKISEVRVSHAVQIGMHEMGFLYTFAEQNRKTTVTFLARYWPMPMTYRHLSCILIVSSWIHLDSEEIRMKNKYSLICDVHGAPKHHSRPKLSTDPINKFCVRISLMCLILCHRAYHHWATHSFTDWCFCLFMGFVGNKKKETLNFPHLFGAWIQIWSYILLHLNTITMQWSNPFPVLCVFQ